MSVIIIVVIVELLEVVVIPFCFVSSRRDDLRLNEAVRSRHRIIKPSWKRITNEAFLTKMHVKTKKKSQVCLELD